MKFIFFILFVCCSISATSQEYWNREDFEIGHREIEGSLREIGFTWQTESSFVLPEVNFLLLNAKTQKKQLDMLAIIGETNRRKVERKVELGSPLPRTEKEKKSIQLSVEGQVREERDVFDNPYFASPFLHNYNYRGFGVRRYTPYR